MTSDARWTDSMPEIYDRALGPTLFEPFGPVLAAAVEEARPHQVLEIAAGTGIATAHLVRVLPDAELTATDLNPAMVAWGRRRVPAARWEVADAQSLDSADDAYDVVACQFGAMFFPDKRRAFAEAARVLRPSGRYVTTIWDSVETSPLTQAFVASLYEVLGSSGPTFLVRTPHGYSDPDAIAEDLRSGGLEPTSIESVTMTGSAPDAATIARGFCEGTPTRFELAEHGDLAALTEQVVDAMTRRLGPGPVSGSMAAWVVRAGPLSDR